MDTIQTGDTYEVCYYFLNNCTIKDIEVISLNGKLACSVIMEGENLPELQVKFFRNDAYVNLFEFRRFYSKVTGYINEAKKKYKALQKQQGGDV